jgi:hypothetical protein
MTLFQESLVQMDDVYSTQMNADLLKAARMERHSVTMAHVDLKMGNKLVLNKASMDSAQASDALRMAFALLASIHV